MAMKRYEIQVGRTPITIETGRMAKQADGATLVRMGDTVVFVAAGSAKEPKPGIDFLPLTVDYRENNFAAGKIPGGFFKREGRPNEKEILTCRLIDRPMRPLFPEGWGCETQISALSGPPISRMSRTPSPSSAHPPRCASPTFPSTRRWARSAWASGTGSVTSTRPAPT